MLIQLLVDNPNSWILPYAKELKEILQEKGHNVRLIHLHKEVTKGEILCLLSCERIFKKLDLNKYNLVVHESDLPKGKGWSPLTWQILEGKNEVPITLFEAVENVDAGAIYLQAKMRFKGTELVDELRVAQGKMTQDLILKFVEKYPNIIGKPQQGESSFYPRRRPEHSQLDISKTLDKQFNLLRVCDNERYPAYFIKDGQKFILKIEKAKE